MPFLERAEGIIPIGSAIDARQDDPLALDFVGKLVTFAQTQRHSDRLRHRRLGLAGELAGDHGLPAHIYGKDFPFDGKECPYQRQDSMVGLHRSTLEVRARSLPIQEAACAAANSASFCFARTTAGLALTRSM